MQTLTSEWGLEPLTVARKIPTVALRYRLGRVHVMTPDDEIVAMIKEAIDHGNAHGAVPIYTPEQREQTIRAALWIHHEQRAEYAGVMSGRF